MLLPRTRYAVTIRIWDNHGESGTTVSWFETGLLGHEGFQANWITHPWGEEFERCPLARHKDHLVTGFVSTPYLCHVLSENGRHDLAGRLLLQEDFPSWLYAVNMGATTIWERWNSIQPNGSIEDNGMNSLNHYAYGSIGEWMYGKLVGMKALEPGYKKICISPTPCKG